MLLLKWITFYFASFFFKIREMFCEEVYAFGKSKSPPNETNKLPYENRLKAAKYLDNKKTVNCEYLEGK